MIHSNTRYMIHSNARYDLKGNNSCVNARFVRILKGYTACFYGVPIYFDKFLSILVTLMTLHSRDDMEWDEIN